MKKKEKTKLTKAALCFSNSDSHISLSAKEEGKARAINMTLYSGKVIQNHWYWGNLAIDTSGIKMAKPQVPILLEHDLDKKIAFGKFMVNDKHELVSLENTFVDTPFAEEFQKLSDQGFPFEASLSGRPVKIQRLLEKEEAEVNGYMMKGPGTIWRESVLREGSVVTFGADPHTKSVAMAETEEFSMEVEETKKDKEDIAMDLTKLKAEFPDLYKEIIALGRAEAETAFSVVKTEMETQITSLTAERDGLQNANKDMNGRVLKLEKHVALSDEKTLGQLADSIATTKLKASKIPERLYSKVRKQLNHQTFVKDGALDQTAFSAAVDTELKDWEVTSDGESQVLGMSFAGSVDTEGELSSATADDIVKRMLKHAGQTVQ